MAATQAEKQQNDVNSEKVQPDQHLNVRNSLLQNGTEKSSVRGGGSVVITKAKNTGTKNPGIDMSQYRQDGGGGPGPGGAPGGNGDPGMSEQDMGPGGEPNLYPAAPTAVSEGPPVGDGHGGYPFSFGARDTHNSSDSNIHAFGPRHGFGGPKQPPPGGAFSQQRFITGQTISQPTGPTPTLNQLLQSSSNVQRYQNSYGHSEPQYSQSWPPKPLTSYGAPGPAYRTQGTVSTICLSLLRARAREKILAALHVACTPRKFFCGRGSTMTI